MDGLLYVNSLPCLPLTREPSMDVPSPPAPVLSKKAAQWAAFLCYVLLVIGLFLKPESSFLGLGLCKNLNALDDEDDSQNDKADGPNHLEPA